MVEALKLCMPGPQDSIFQHPFMPEVGPEGGHISNLGILYASRCGRGCDMVSKVNFRWIINLQLTMGLETVGYIIKEQITFGWICPGL